MEYEEEFKFLKIELIQRKNADELKEEDRKIIKLSLLDKNNNPCSFMIFNKDIIKKILSTTFVGLQLINVQFELVFNNNNWNVRLLNIHE